MRARIASLCLLVIYLATSLQCAQAQAAGEKETRLAAPRKKVSIVFPILSPRISSKFGRRVHPIRRFSQYHKGIDLAAPENSHVRAVAAGRVVFAGKYAGFGKLVTIEHPDSYASLYAHLTEILVQAGDVVSPGALIGRVGSTGHATGPHLHFEWRHEGKALDPLKVFPSLGESADG